MKAYTHEVDQREVVLDLDIRWLKAHFSLFLAVSPFWAFPHVTPSILHRPSLCSYLGDVDIDAVVKEPITAGIKGLKVDPCSQLCHLCQSLPVLDGFFHFLLNVTADGDAAHHSGASHRRGAPGGRSHLLFHSPPSKQ